MYRNSKREADGSFWGWEGPKSAVSVYEKNFLDRWVNVKRYVIVTNLLLLAHLLTKSTDVPNAPVVTKGMCLMER